MMARTKIEWTDMTWNPVTGCTPISEACQNCYAKRMSKRLAGRCGYPEDEPFKVTLHPERLDEPFKWRKPRRVFVCSMSDLFHEKVDEGFLCRIFDTMLAAEQHTYLILTKRPERMKDFITRCIHGIPKNIWLGVTAENQQRAEERIPILLQIPAAVRFVSIEPMLGPVDLSKWLGGTWYCETCECTVDPEFVPFSEIHYPCENYLDFIPGIDWVICGSESGPNHRKTKIEWIRDLREQCISANVPFFLKQMEINGRMVKMPELDGKIWDQFPEVQYAS
jgi:protein gp37